MATADEILPLLWPIALCVILGIVAVYLLLPRPRPFRPLWGGAAGGLAVILAGALLVKPGGVWAETVLFYAFAGIAILSGGLLITQSNPVRAALSFALVVLSSCGLFLLQAAPFLMAATTIIYAGAIIVTFLFVLMLAQQEGRSDADWRSREPLLATIAGFVLLAALLWVLVMTYAQPRTTTALIELDDVLDQAVAATQKPSDEEVVKALDWNQFFVNTLNILKNAQQAPSFASLEKKVDNLEYDWLGRKHRSAGDNAQFLKKAVSEIREEVHRARRTLGDLHPQPDKGEHLSDFSGPPPSNPPPGDPQAKSLLPADNTAYLGRSLFTDYLLAVELAGTLLLVATVGAIVIASRREERTS
jgi:NADH:ubiquinone oxidoreductase subunit 6 (subunit J)